MEEVNKKKKYDVPYNVYFDDATIEEAKEIQLNNQDAFNSLSHYIRCAVIKMNRTYKR